MRIEFKPAITNTAPKKRKNVIAKLKQVVKDTFTKSTSTKKEPEESVLVSRKYPNWCDGPDTPYRNRTIATTTRFYPEDEKLMETMTLEEQSRYKDYLITHGRFYRVESSGSLKEFEEFARSLGLDPKKYYIKD